MTEVLVFDTQAPCDSVTGERPVRAVIKQCKGKGSEALSLEMLQDTRQETSQEDVIIEGGTLDEVIVEGKTATSPWWHGMCQAVVLAVVAAVLLKRISNLMTRTSTKHNKQNQT